MKLRAAAMVLALLPGPTTFAQPTVLCDGLQCTMSQSDFERLFNLMEAHRQEIQGLREQLRGCRA